MSRDLRGGGHVGIISILPWASELGRGLGLS